MLSEFPYVCTSTSGTIVAIFGARRFLGVFLFCEDRLVVITSYLVAKMRLFHMMRTSTNTRELSCYDTHIKKANTLGNSTRMAYHLGSITKTKYTAVAVSSLIVMSSPAVCVQKTADAIIIYPSTPLPRWQ